MKRPWYEFQVVESHEQLVSSRGSVYHSLSLDNVITTVLEGPERHYGIVALPCVIKSVRLAQKRFPALRRRIRYVFGLTCGGLRSRLFPELLTSLMGQEEGVLRYRSKPGSRTALDFRAEISSLEKRKRIRFLGMFGFFWINEIGMLHPCLFCDDIFAELADATFMDAWLPEFKRDCRGTNLVISRKEAVSQVISQLFDERVADGGFIDARRVEESQEKVLARRRDRLEFRVKYAKKTRDYVPVKRQFVTRPLQQKALESETAREMLFFYRSRQKLLKWRGSVSRYPRPLRRFTVYWLSWKILFLAARHGALHRTFREAKHVFARFFRFR